MAHLTRWRNKGSRWFLRWLPDSLFGGLAWLLVLAVVGSHVLVLSLLFKGGPGEGPLASGEHRPPPGAFGPPPHRPPPLEGVLFDIVVRLGSVIVVAGVGARWLSQPMRRMAAAAKQLGQDIQSPPLMESGTRECREATQVFNQMQSKIRAQMAERDLFVAALSHDLRTPLTRMTLRTESLDDEILQQRFRKDLSEMETLIRSTLDLLRGQVDDDECHFLDVHMQLDSVVGDYRETGRAVAFAPTGCSPPEGLLVNAQGSALRRCLCNLIDNALFYGQGAQVAVARRGEWALITVDDSGPGIPEQQLAQVGQPFFRVETSRNRKTGGTGLGLAISRALAARFGGRVTLANRQEGGLRATLELPLYAGPA